MALMKGPRKGNLLEPSLETSLEQQILSRIEGVAGTLRDVQSQLFGSGDSGRETPYGRMPMVERTAERALNKAEVLETSKASQADHLLLKADVEVLKSAKVSQAAYFNSARIFGHIITGCVGAALLALVEHLVK
jgi:hypothetical protein